MLSPRLDWMFGEHGSVFNFGCCSSAGCDSHGPQHEFQVHLSTDMAEGSGRSNMGRHQITRADSFDITFTPRTFAANSNANAGASSNPLSGWLSSPTPRQQTLKEQLELPLLHNYPTPPNCSPDMVEETRKKLLLNMYQDFALDLHAGMYLTQLTSSRDYSDIHCQLMEDMTTLKLDQSNGRIIEFPLTGVSKVYRIVKTDDKWYSANSPVPGASVNTEHIVVVEFMRRKLAFVFKELQVSQRFLMCMELLIRRAQQKQAKQAMRSLTPAISATAAMTPRRTDR